MNGEKKKPIRLSGHVAVVLVWGILAAFFVLLVATIAGLAADPVGAGDQVRAIKAAMESVSYKDLLIRSNYSWWLLAQVWALKGAGILSMHSAQALSGAWMVVAVVCGVVICKRWLCLPGLSCVVFMVAFGGSAEVLSWAGSPHSIYMASIALGGIVLAVILSLDKCELQPTGTHAIVAASGFMLACLYSPVQGFIVGAGLLILLAWPNRDGHRPKFWSRVRLVVWLGLPAMLVCVIPTLLFPHVQIGKPPSYAYPYLLETATNTTGPVSFVLSRIWYLIVQVFSIHSPRNSGLEWQGVLMIALAFIAIASVFVKDVKRSWRVMTLVIAISLVPAVILSLLSWYPFGYVRYEFYVVVPIALLPAIGIVSLCHAARFVVPWRRVVSALGWLSLVLATTLFIVTWTSRSRKVWDAAATGCQLLTNLAQVLEGDPKPVFVADFWSQEMQDLIKGSHVPDFVVPRAVLVNQRALTETELKALRDVVSSHDRVVLLISGSSTQTNPYVGVVDVMNSLDFTKQTMLDADERLTQWHAPSVE